MVSLRRVVTADLTSEDIEKLRGLLWSAFGDDPEEGFTEDDWLHALGGRHVLAEESGRILAHASVVTRTLEVDGQPWTTGYVEAVATDPSCQGQGIGTEVMKVIAEAILEHYQLGALGTGSFYFYERLGWRRWLGQSGVRTSSGVDLTPEDDGFIMIFATAATAHLHLSGVITCDWRPGDVW